MSRRDSHPEEWLDRARAQLRDDEQRELARHLEQCDACALQDKLKPSLMEQLALLPGDGVLITGAIERAVQGFATTPPPPPALKVVRPGRLLAMSAAGALAIGAAGVIGVWAVAPGSPTTVVTPSPAPAQAGPTPQLLAAPELVAAPEPAPPAELPGGSEPAPPAPEAARAPAGTPAALRAAPSPRSPQGPAVPSRNVEPAETPAQLFAQANSLRRGKDFARAERLYRRLQTAFAGSPEDVLSRIVLGRMYLDQLGDPRAALRQFDAYLERPSQTSLRDEAMIGRALALGRLGRSAEERSAWRRFLEAFPGSMYVPKAKARLKDLGG